MSRPIYVVGHKNPDTDAIVAAIGYAELLRAQREEQVVAARAGDLRPETAYLLDRFGLHTPRLIEDVRLRVGDVMTTPARTVNQRASLYEVGVRQQELGMRPLPVVDDEGRLRGMAEAQDFAKVFFQGLDLTLADEVQVDFENVVRALDAKVLVAPVASTIRRFVMVAALSFESIMRRLEPGIVLVVGDRTDVQIAALEFGVGMLIVTGGSPVLPAVVDLARVQRVPLLAVEHHTAATLRLIHMSIPVRHIMRPDPPRAEPDDLVDDLRDVLASERALSVVDDDGRVIGVITRVDVLRGQRRRVVLVDHNERGQAVDGIEQAEIVGVIDHHRVGDLATAQPPFMRFEPVGACSTLVAKLFDEAGVAPSAPIAGALLGAILADTLLFQSPTTTGEDRRLAAKMETISGVDAEELGESMIRIASDLSGRDARSLVRGDFKSFALDGQRFGVGVIETGNAAAVLARRDELLREMKRVRAEDYASVLLVITDVVHSATTILIVGHGDAVARAFDAELHEGVRIELPGVYSRKKQVVPLLGRVRDLIPASGGARP